MKRQATIDPNTMTGPVDGASLKSQLVSDPSDMSVLTDGAGLGSQLGSGLGEMPTQTDGISRQKPSPLDPSDMTERSPDAQKIAQLAYSYWEARRGDGGSAEEDWYRAERALSPQPSSAEK